ncbi:hypothetical protein [Marinimicrobium sp. C2-29]|uniref:hypothetical protein n=1 Tax=Marinimicrobium sp. C2-29 TaxID=3139825 RepID=UPI0031394C87
MKKSAIIYGPKNTQETKDKQAIIDAIRVAIDAEITAPDFPGSIDFDTLRANNAKTKSDWPQGFIHQAASDMGLTVQTDDL